MVIEFEIETRSGKHGGEHIEKKKVR